MKNMERRFVESLEVRYVAGENGQPNKLSGYAATFNSLSHDLGGFRERIAPSAFANSIAQGGDIRCLFNHNGSQLLGRTSSKTLQLREDGKGLFYEVELPNTTYANDLKELASRNDITGCSFGFRCIKDKWDDTSDGIIRTLIEVELFEVSPVFTPAYPETELSLRAIDPAVIERAKSMVERPTYKDRMDKFRRILAK